MADARNYLVTAPGIRREIIAATSPEQALRTFCRRHGAGIGRRCELRVEDFDEAMERERGNLYQSP